MRTIFAFILIVAQVACFATNSKVYNYAPDAPKSDDFAVKIDGVDSLVYPAPIADITAFDITGKTSIEIKSSKKIEKLVVRPLSAKINAVQDGNTIKFEIDKPCNLSVEVNGRENPLLIFANPPIKNIPAKDDKNVMFFEAGKIYEIGLRKEIKSDMTVYIEGGAIVYGTFMAGNRHKVLPLENIRVCGNGFISGERTPHFKNKEKKPSSNHVEFHNVTNLSLEGFAVISSPNWAIPLNACKNVLIDNVKTVSDQGCDDGIDIVSCQNVLVQNCFLRNKDDCIAIKAGVNYSPKYYIQNAPNIVSNITIKKCVLWNGIWGNACEIGFETLGDEMKNITFEDLDIIHIECNPTWKEGKEGVFTIHNGDRAHIHNILYKNIRVEDPERYIIDFRIMHSRYSKDKQRGKISNVRFEDISVTTNDPLKICIQGFDEKSDITGISFKNFIVNGKPINESKDIIWEETKFTDVKTK